MPIYMKSSRRNILPFLILIFVLGSTHAQAQKTLRNVAGAGVQFLSPDRISEYSATYERVLAEGSSAVFNATGSVGGWSKEGGEWNIDVVWDEFSNPQIQSSPFRNGWEPYVAI
jgi:hypothetical protein